MSKIILIDDDPFLLDMYSTHFTDAGCKVVGFKDVNGDIAQRVLDVNPDLIVTGIIFGMPEVRNGFEAIELLKNDERTKDIPVFILSNQGSKEEIERGKSLGAIDYIVKADTTPEEVVKKILSTKMK